MKHRRIRRLCLLQAAVGALVSGCATAPYHAYEGPTRPVSELALITESINTNSFTVAMLGKRERHTYEHTLVTKMDGREVSPKGRKSHVRGGALYVLPGQHEFLCLSRLEDPSSASAAGAMGALPAAIMAASAESHYRDSGTLVLDAKAAEHYTVHQRRNTVKPFNAVFWAIRGSTGKKVAESTPDSDAKAVAAVVGGSAETAAANAIESGNKPFFLDALPADRAVLCVFRVKRMVGAIVSYQVLDANSQILTLGNGTYAYRLVSPGDHLFTSSFGVNKQSMEVTLKPGKVYYYQSDLGGKMIPVQESAALEAIKKLRPAK